MRKTTLLWLGLAAITGVTLFHTSQIVQAGRAELASLQKKTQGEEESIRVLQAEWSYLNQPQRLEKLSREYLDLKPMQGRQFARLEDIPQKPLPAEETAEVQSPAVDAGGDIEKPAVKKEPAVTPAEKPKAVAKPKPLEKPKAVAKPVAQSLPKTLKPVAPPEKAFGQKDVAQKDAVRKQDDTASGGRQFGDLMKSLGVQ